MDAMDFDGSPEPPMHTTHSGDDILRASNASVLTFAKPAVVRWHVFGNTPNYLSVDLQAKPTWWRKLLTRIFLGSVWEDL